MGEIIKAILTEIDDLTIQNAMKHRVSARLEEIVPTVVIKEMCTYLENSEVLSCTSTDGRYCTEQLLQRPRRSSVSVGDLRIKRRKDER